MERFVQNQGNTNEINCLLLTKARTEGIEKLREWLEVDSRFWAHGTFMAHFFFTTGSWTGPRTAGKGFG